MERNELSKNELVEYKTPNGLIDLNQVSSMLLEAMKEVKGNPASIPQAQCMTEVASRIVDITLAQVKQGTLVLEMLRVKRGHGD